MKAFASFFIFYFYVMIDSKKRFEVAMRYSFIIASSPMVLAFLYLCFAITFPFIPFSPLTLLVIPILLLNVVYVNAVSDKGWNIQLEKEKEEEREKTREKYRRQGEHRRQQREWQQQFYEWQYQEEEEKKRDNNYENAIKLLGLNDNPSDAEIKSAYRKLSKIHHPDLGGTQENFIRLNKAYKYLKN